jgi:hypothetical protein
MWQEAQHLLFLFFLMFYWCNYYEQTEYKILFWFLTPQICEKGGENVKW